MSVNECELTWDEGQRTITAKREIPEGIFSVSCCGSGNYPSINSVEGSSSWEHSFLHKEHSGKQEKNENMVLASSRVPIHYAIYYGFPLSQLKSVLDMGMS